MTRVLLAHPAERFGPETEGLASELAGAPAVCVNPGGATFEEMVDEIEAERRRLGGERAVFWGMSGGGWLAQVYARRHPDALAGIVVESACLCFRERLADPACALSPSFPAWRPALESRGLLGDPGAAPLDDVEWVDVGIGHVLRRRGGPAVLFSPMPVSDGMRQAMPLLWTFDARAWIGEVRVPALVIAGSADPVVPSARVRAVHEAIPGSTFVLVDGAGHVPSTERRAPAVDAIRRFVAATV